MRTPNGEPRRFVLAAIATESDDCIVWPYAVSPEGYGKVKSGGKNRCAHRVVLTAVTPPPQPSMYAVHGDCRNRACINPRHLSWHPRTKAIQTGSSK